MFMDLDQGAGVGDPSPMVARHREYYGSLGMFEEMPRPAQPLCSGCRWEVVQGFGAGFTEVLHLGSGPNVGICGYKFDTAPEGDYRKYCSSLQFSIMLTGSFRISSLGDGRSETVRAGDVWFSAEGAEDEVRCTHPAGELISGVSVEVSRSMLDHWLGTASCKLSRTLERMVDKRLSHREFMVCGSFPRMRCLSACHPLMQVARSLLMTEHDTVCGRLMFESRALDYLSQALALDGSLPERMQEDRSQRRKAVEAAVDILDEEWGAPPTISALSRRVGVNECYLKTDFRERTGLSIGEYVRRIRMESALALIESSRCSVLQAATFVGYSNPSHFSRAFKRFHGYLPSSCLCR
ncbi:MAG: AraC family transcriptional regulator [Pseudodesulfovibrio sp.]|uniref:Helix-turn-helix, AraC domain protein n=1 Tax=Pseudodesulfovibrio aespoeensis (strain ATCC 700646 / DSM 10631 / Aspo-2) TaxID=643562 RepID=E6VYC6_PSEA9|nr:MULTISPECIES: AraC family transcriptional regulator [Pseudodesulfovibrio]MBU4191494.1 AraC family transcriptional regulator [Pseudomonadota bacterium]ADU61584.1 Helix-turn-helix, AraC domain protein [Pseudodesulfovibrio aespoeensis Aspo-2]MBU4244324.1 AraC family transcriptional regulator [Pseudomonadota bacterium]MBU4379470.1 AraC family transcriptional regulator [Pseudomonadota bacterium]MBU4474452.1 AraC family transcriptional regulator [Pseudomonadota bacterium]